jgi:hypothetical protein
MKKKIGVLCALIVVVVAVFCKLAYPIMNTVDRTTLNALTYTAVAIDPKLNSGCNPIVAYTSDNTAFLIATDAAGTAAAPFAADTYFTHDCIKTDSTGVLFYAIAAAGTPDLVVIIGIDKN